MGEQQENVRARGAFVGRSYELEALLGALAGTKGGHGAICLLSGG